MQDVRKFEVWEYARRMATAVYRHTNTFPSHETFGLRAQMRPAAVSVCANIADGCGRGSSGEWGRFLSIAMGSASELECETVLALNLGFLDSANHDALLERVARVKRMLAGLLKTVRQSTDNREPTTDNRT